MTVVRFTSWKNGFVPNRLIRLLRDYGLGLAESHDLATRFADGAEISVCFDDKSRADGFARQASELGAQLVVNEGIRVAS